MIVGIRTGNRGYSLQSKVRSIAAFAGVLAVDIALAIATLALIVREVRVGFESQMPAQWIFIAILVVISFHVLPIFACGWGQEAITDRPMTSEGWGRIRFRVGVSFAIALSTLALFVAGALFIVASGSG